MQFHFDISANQNKLTNPQPQPQPQPAPAEPPPQPSFGDRLLETLEQMMAEQREGFAQIQNTLNEHLNHARSVQAEHMARWRNLMGRWEKQFPELASRCKTVYPVLEKAYMRMIHNMVEDLVNEGEDAFDSEFTLMDYLDRHGMRLGQFYQLLTIIGPLSETVNTNNESR